MAEFGIKATDLSAPQGAGARVIEGVQPATSSIQIPSGISQLGVDLVDSLRRGEIQKAKDQAAQRENQVMGQYTREIAALQDAATQGMSPAEVAAKTRRINAQYTTIAAENGWLESFKKSQDLALGATGTGAIVNQAEEQRKANVTYLRGKDVYVPPDADDNYINQLMRHQTDKQTMMQDFTFNEQQAAANRSATGFNQSQEDRRRKEETTKLITGFAGTSFQELSVQTDKIIADHRAGRIGIEEARAEIQKLSAKSSQGIDAITAADPSMGTPFRNTLTTYLDTQVKRLEGENVDLDNEAKAIVNRSKVVSLQKSPELAQAAALSELVGRTVAGSQTVESITAQALVRFTTQDTTSASDVPNVVGGGIGKTAEVTLYSHAKEGLNLVRSGQTSRPEVAKQEAFQLTNNILDQLGDKFNSRKVKDTDLKEVAQFMASPEFAYFVKEGGMRTDVADTARDAYMQLYRRSVDQGVQAQLNQPIPTGVRQNRPNDPDISGTTMDALDIRFTNGQVAFVPKTGQQYSSPSISRIVSERARELSGVSQSLTQIVRIGAHLEGTTDYQAYWEANKASILPYYYGDQEKLKGDKIAPDGTVYEWVGGPNGNTRDRSNWRVKSTSSGTTGKQ